MFHTAEFLSSAMRTNTVPNQLFLAVAPSARRLLLLGSFRRCQTPPSLRLPAFLDFQENTLLSLLILPKTCKYCTSPSAFLPKLLHISKKSCIFAAQNRLKAMQHPNLYIIAGPNGAGKIQEMWNQLIQKINKAL